MPTVHLLSSSVVLAPFSRMNTAFLMNTHNLHLSHLSFSAPWWARNRHVQTIWPRFFQKRAALQYRMQRLELPDGDFVDLAWGPTPTTCKGVVVMFHGLEGSIRSHYAHDMMARLSGGHWQVVLMHFRGCSGEPNRLARAYHSGETEDARYFLQWLEQKYPNVPKAAVGFSLGGNMLLKLLGESGDVPPLSAAVAVSAPMRLDLCSQSIGKGFSRVYQDYLMHSMKRNLLKKLAYIDYPQLIGMNEKRIRALSNFWEFDQYVTAPLHGFQDARDYYTRCSSRQFLPHIQRPTLIIHSLDDPFMSPEVVPKANELSPTMSLCLSQHGGHVGFMQGPPWRPQVWLHEQVARFLAHYLP